MPTNPASDDRPRRRPALFAALAACVLGLAAIVFLPIGWPLDRFVVWLYTLGRTAGIPDLITVDVYATVLNILLFAVPTAIAALLWPRVRWWVWGIAVAVTSAGIELVQLLALPRDSTVADVIANTAGAAIGAGVVALVRRTHARNRS